MTIPVVFLPGLDGEPFTAAKISEHLRVARLDVFTYPTGRAMDWETLASLIGARMERSGASLLIGESFGGAVAQEVALRSTGKLRGLCLISTFSREVEVFANWLGRTATRVLPNALMRPVSRRLAGWKLAGTLAGEDREKFLSRFAQLDYNELARRLKLLSGFDTRARLGNLKLPVEVVYGRRDTIAAEPDQLNAWKSLPNCRVQGIEGFGHLVSAEAAPQVAALIDAWAERAAQASGLSGKQDDNRGN